MKVLIISHEPSLTPLYKTFVERNSGTAITPPEDGKYDIERAVTLLLDEKPDKVLMDFNYGNGASEDPTPILTIANKMRTNGYDVPRQLLGVTGRSDLTKRLSEELGLAIIPKTEFQRLKAFLTTEYSPIVLYQPDFQI